MSRWKTVRLDQCSEIISGATPSTNVDAFWDGDICWATPKDLSNLESANILDTPRKLTLAGLESCSATVLPAGSVLFSSRAPIGHVAVNAVPMATNQGFKSFIPYPDKLDAKFLYHWLRTNRSYLESLGNGATFKEVSKAIVSRVKIPLPPVPDQQRIAEVLDKAEELRIKRRAALTQFSTLSQSIFLEMFGDTLSIFNRWPVKRLGELLDFLTSGSRGWARFYSDAGDIFLRIQNVCQDELKLEDVAYVHAPDTAESRRTRVRPGDVLLSITADLGRTAVVPDNIGTAFINQHLSILRTQAAVPQFLSSYLSSPAGQREVLGRNKHAVKAGLNFDDIRSFRIPMPPIDLQHQFARRIAAVEKLKASYRASLAELDALFASLQHRAFRGEL